MGGESMHPLRDINHLSLYHLMHNKLKSDLLYAPHLWKKINDANNSRYGDSMMTIIFIYRL